MAIFDWAAENYFARDMGDFDRIDLIVDDEAYARFHDPDGISYKDEQLDREIQEYIDWLDWSVGEWEVA